MTITEACTWLQNLEVPTIIGESGWLFPTLETVHVLALVLVVGSISMIDLRLLGISNQHRAISELTAETLPWTWTAFCVAATTGSLLFSSKALTYYQNWPFCIKMFCLVLAAINMLVFHRIIARDMAGWDRGSPPRAARLAGGFSLVLWIVIVGVGRWIGFTT